MPYQPDFVVHHTVQLKSVSAINWFGLLLADDFVSRLPLFEHAKPVYE